MTLRSVASVVFTRRTAFLAGLFVLAVILRLTYLREVKDLPTYQSVRSDESAAHHPGLACMRGQLPPHAYLKAPLYTYFLGGIYRLFGPNPYDARLVQAAISSLAPVLIFLIAERLFGRAAAVIAGLLGTTYWMFVFYSVEIVDASVASLFYLLLLYLLVISDDRKWWQFALAGALMAVGAITRPNVLVFAPVLAIAVFVVTLRKTRERSAGYGNLAFPTAEAMGDAPIHRLPATVANGPGPDTQSSRAQPRLGAWRCGLLNVIALTAGCCAVIAPITIRNRIVGGEWVLIAAYGGLNLWVGNNPDSDGKNVVYMVGEGVPEAAPIDPNDVWSDALGDRVARAFAEKTVGRPLRRGELDSFFARMAVAYIQLHPERFIADTLRRCCYLFNAYEFANVRDPYLICKSSRVLKVLSTVHFGVLCPFLVVGILVALGTRTKPAGLVYYLLMLASMSIGGVLFVVNSRFRVPLVYLAIPAVAWGVVCLVGLIRSGPSWSRRIVYGCVFVGAAVFSNVDLLGYRPPYHTDLRFAEAMACTGTSRRDLLLDATTRLEEALLADEATGRRTWSTLITHARPYSLLYLNYARLGDLQKAFQYGTLMVLREPYHHDLNQGWFELLTQMDPNLGLGLFNRLMRENRKEAAGLLLDILWARLPLYEAVKSNLLFAEMYKDPVIMRRTEQLLKDLIQHEPNEPTLRQLLDHVYDQMKSWGVPTQPATSSTPASTRGGPTP